MFMLQEQGDREATLISFKWKEKILTGEILLLAHSGQFACINSKMQKLHVLSAGSSIYFSACMKNGILKSSTSMLVKILQVLAWSHRQEGEVPGGGGKKPLLCVHYWKSSMLFLHK